MSARRKCSICRQSTAAADDKPTTVPLETAGGLVVVSRSQIATVRSDFCRLADAKPPEPFWPIIPVRGHADGAPPYPRNTSASCHSRVSRFGWSSGARGTLMARPAKRSYSRPPVEVACEVVADAEAIIRRDGDVASVVEAVDVGAQQESVAERVRAAVRVGAHVRGLEGGQRVLARGRRRRRRRW
jgi:hypothetical protein